METRFVFLFVSKTMFHLRRFYTLRYHTEISHTHGFHPHVVITDIDITQISYTHLEIISISYTSHIHSNHTTHLGIHLNPAHTHAFEPITDIECLHCVIMLLHVLNFIPS